VIAYLAVVALIVARGVLAESRPAILSVRLSLAYLPLPLASNARNALTREMDEVNIRRPLGLLRWLWLHIAGLKLF